MKNAFNESQNLNDKWKTNGENIATDKKVCHTPTQLAQNC